MSAITSPASRTQSDSARTCSTTARSSRARSGSPTPRKSSSTRFPSGCIARIFPRNAYVVIVTRGHTHDLDALRALAARDLRYLGLIGSKAKVKRIYDALLAEGMPPECLQRVNAPVGLDIGAVSPEEIAVAILAELIAVRRGKIQDPRARRRLDALGPAAEPRNTAVTSRSASRSGSRHAALIYAIIGLALSTPDC